MSEADAHTQDMCEQKVTLASVTLMRIIVNGRSLPFSDLVVAYIPAA